MRRGLPSGTVTFMFTDIEGSTALLRSLGSEGFAVALARHRDVVRAAIAENGGVEIDTQGDAFFVAFPTAIGAVEAARTVQEQLAAAGNLRIRIGLHTGTPLIGEEGYVGADVHLGARIAAAGHGGQVLLSGSTEALVDLEVTDLGEHHLKDFVKSVRIYQLGSDDFPPLKTLSLTNLPRAAGSLVGRSEQLEDVRALLREGARFLTLTGPGGAGKSRLALEIATELVGSVKAGVFWVGLASVRDPALVLPTIAQTIDTKQSLAAGIGAREMVLVLDNLEHVAAAAGELADLLEHCPNLTILATSRETLRVRGESVYPVPSLETAEAVELFAKRATVRVDTDVPELCERLDNLPLAVELAAARTRILTPRQILERLDRRLDLLKGGRDADSRQQTLRATIDWSYDLLSGDEADLFARLSVFRGGVDLDAAESVVDADLDLLESLVDKSLVRFTDGRFWMLETIREYAAERLSTSKSHDEVLRGHAHHYLELAEGARAEVLGVDPRQALDRLQADHDNLRAALDWFDSSGDVQSGLRMAGALWEFWCLRFQFVEGFQRLEHLLSLDPTPTGARADALTGSAHLAVNAGADAELIRTRTEEALALQRQFGDAWDVAFAEFQFARLLEMEGDAAATREHMGPVVEKLRDVGDEHRELQAMRVMAWTCQELGDLEGYHAMHEQILERGRSIGDLEVQWWSLNELANYFSRTGRHAEALRHVHEGFTVLRAMGDEPSDMTLVWLGSVLARAELTECATLALSLAQRIQEQYDFSYAPSFASMRDEAVARCRASLGESTFSATWKRGPALTEPEPIFTMAADALGVSLSE